jgi:hypothetical protein
MDTSKIVEHPSRKLREPLRCVGQEVVKSRPITGMRPVDEDLNLCGMPVVEHGDQPRRATRVDGR